MDTKLVTKSFIGGLAGALVFLLLMQWLLNSAYAPFNITPVAAFVLTIGIPAIPWTTVVTFLFGAVMSVILALLYGPNLKAGNGLSLGISLWLIMMVGISPIIDWGVFGTGDAHFKEKEDTFYLAKGWIYPIATLVIHLIYGITVGLINRYWAIIHLFDDDED